MQICSFSNIRLLTFVGLLCGSAGLVGPTQAQTSEEQTMQAAASVLDEIMAIPAKGIPSALLAEAEGVAIIPNVIKGGFIVGARYGNGVLVIKENGFWRAPVFITLTGGNVGWQAGVQATDIVLVFKTQKSIQGILSGTFTLGVDAAAAAGPVGRQASAATDAGLKSEIYSYSRSRGIFAGVSFDGSALTINQFANAAYYQQAGAGTVPPSARVVVDKIVAYSQPQAASGPAPTAQTAPLNPHTAASVNEVEMIRRQLAQTAPELYEILPPEWQAYLGLPREIFSGGTAPSPEALQASLSRFATVSSDPRFRTLAEQPKFQSTYGLLRHYAQAAQQESNSISLPPPPASPGSGSY